MPPFTVEGATVNLYLGAPKVKKTRKEEGDAPKHVKGKSGLDVDPASELVKNLRVTCDVDAARSETHVLRIAFDPTKVMGRSKSGKSFTVSTSGGFQPVLDGTGRLVCRLSLNAYKPAPPITGVDVKEAVATVLKKTPKEERRELIFLNVYNQVREELGCSGDDDGEIKSQVKEEVKLFLSQE
ncbi:hypothetical protein STCU_04729 [Strigomonas culicis]|nr:hypothetical protein STCU_04729 [Strigomonas culicis]|eukprot:EPY29092.1 hypothetical protein STCU_04729 [Strigomonas culicis]